MLRSKRFLELQTRSWCYASSRFLELHTRSWCYASSRFLELHTRSWCYASNRFLEKNRSAVHVAKAPGTVSAKCFPCKVGQSRQTSPLKPWKKKGPGSSRCCAKKNSFVKFQNPDFTPKISKSIRRHNARRFFEISECRFYHGCLGVVHHVVSQVQEMSRYMHHNPPAYGYTKDLRALGLWCHCHSQNHKCQQTSEEPMQFWKGWKWMEMGLVSCEMLRWIQGRILCKSEKRVGIVITSCTEIRQTIYIAEAHNGTLKKNGKHDKSENRANELDESAVCCPLRSLHFRYCSCCHAESCQNFTNVAA